MLHNLPLVLKGGVIVRMVLGLSSGIFMPPAWRDVSPGGPSVIVDAIPVVAIGARPVRRGSRSQSLRYVGDVAVEVNLWHPGEASNADPGAQVGVAKREETKRRGRYRRWPAI